MDYELFLVRQAGRVQRGTFRVLRFLHNAISLATMTPSSATTQIAYQDIVAVRVSPDDSTEFWLTVEEGRRRELHKLACETRAEFLTSLYNRLDDINGFGTDFPMKKFSIRANRYVDTVLRVRSTSIVKLSPADAGGGQGRPRKKIDMYDIQRLETLNDDDRLVLIHLSSRIMRLSLSNALAFVLLVQQNMKNYLGIDIEPEVISTQDMSDGLADENEQLITKPHLYEFVAHKRVNDDGSLQEERLLRLTKEEMIEMLADEVVCAHSLHDIRGVVVLEDNETEVVMEYKSWRPTHYHLGDRDGFVAGLGDTMALRKIDSFTIRLESMFDCTIPGRVPQYFITDFENHLLSKLWVTYTSERDSGKWFPIIREYSCNIQRESLSYSGKGRNLLNLGGESLCVEPRLMEVVADLMKDSFVKHSVGPRYLLPCCIVLERLLSARACFDAVKNHPEVISALFSCISRVTSPVVSFVAARAVRAALRFRADSGPKDNAITQKEMANRHSVLTPENMHQLAAVLRLHTSTGQNPLQLLGVLDVLITAVNSPFFDTEQERNWQSSFEASLMPVCDLICALCRSSSPVIYYSNAQFFMSLLNKLDHGSQDQLQKEALSQGVILVFLKHAIFSELQRVRDLSCKLLYVLMDGNDETRQFLDSILPKGVMLLNDWKISTQRVVDKEVRIACWLETLEALRTEEIVTPVLVWNSLKRRELLKFLEEEIEAFNRAWTVSNEVSYNYLEVHLVYSFASENHGTVVAGINLEVLVDEQEQENASYGWKMPDPRRLFQSLFHSLMLGFTVLQERGVAEVDLRLAVHALSWVYERYSHQVQDLVLDLMMIEIVVEMLREAYDNEQKVLAFKLLSFLLLLMEFGGRDHVLRFVRTNGEKVMVPMIVTTLAKCCTDVQAFESATGPVSTSKRSLSISNRSISVNSGLSEKMNMSITTRPYRVSDDLQRFVSFRTRASVRWLDEQLNEMLLFGLGLDMLDVILRVSATEATSSLVPPPKAVLALGTEEILCHLAQMLLRVQEPTFGRLLAIVRSIAVSNKDALSKVYRHGLFEMLLWKLICGTITVADRLAIGEFLAASHLRQSPDSLAHSVLKHRGKSENGIWQDSILRLYLPEGVIMKLCTEGPHSFVELVLSEEESPEVIWNSSMRNRLVKHLERTLQHSVRARAENPLAINLFFPRPAQVYPELADAVYSTPFYLQNLLDMERFSAYVITDPAAFHNSLMQDLRSLASGVSSTGMVTAEWHNNMKRILLLLRAQGFVLQQYPHIHLPDDTEMVLIDVASPALYVCSSMREVTPPSAIEILHQSLRVLRRVAASSDEDLDVSSTALEFAMSVLEIGQQCQLEDASLAEPGFNEMLESALTSALHIAELAASSREGRQQLGDDPRWHKGLWWILSRAVTNMMLPDENPKALAVELAALNCLNLFAGDEKFGFDCVQLGFHLPLLLLAVPDEKIQVKVRSHCLEQSCQAMLNSSVTALRTLVATLNRTGGMEKSTGQPMGRAAFLCILPMALLVSLEEDEDGPANFIRLSALNLEQPLAIWNEPIRQELRQRVKERFDSHSEAVNNEVDFEGNELEWLFNFVYETLKGQLVIGGIFIQGFASGQWKGFRLPDAGEFVDSIQDFLHSNLKVIVVPGSSESVEVFDSSDDTDETGSVDGASTITPADYMTVMTAFEECLKYCIQEEHEDLLIQFRFPLFARIARSRSFLTSVKVAVCKLVAVLATHDGMREELVFSELWGAMTVQLWDTIVAYPEEGTEEVMLATLHVLHLISLEIPSTLAATNYFTIGSVFLPVLALFLKVELPPLQAQDPYGGGAKTSPLITESTKTVVASPALAEMETEMEKGKFENEEPISDKVDNGAELETEHEEGLADTSVAVANGGVKMEDSPVKAGHGSENGNGDIPHSVRVAAARIISQLLLAASGLRSAASTPLGKTLTRRATTLERAISRSIAALERGSTRKVFDVFDDVVGTTMDVYELSSWIEPGMEDRATEPFLVRTLLLFLPLQILSVLACDPEQACSLADEDSCTPLLVWDERARNRVRAALMFEVEKIQESAKIRGKHGLLPWHVAKQRPVFLSWILSTVADDEGTSLSHVAATRDDYAEGYVRELYIGGFYLDQFLRNPDFEFGDILERRFLRELRKYISVAAPSHGNHAKEFSYDDRRRLLLAQLFLFKVRPQLLAGSSLVDIFLSVSDFISGSSESEFQGLVQPALLLFHCSAVNHDIADYMVTEELLTMLSGLLSLNVPDEYAGFAATDPRICCLNLILRLIRLSSRAVQLSIRMGLLPKIADIVVDINCAVGVRQRAAEVLAVMCADKRRGIEVSRHLDKRIPSSRKGYGAWQIPLNKILDTVVDNKTLRHFMRHTYPSPWWKLKSSEESEISAEV